MGILKKDPAKEAQKAAAAAAKAQAEREAAFAESPQGRARAAKQSGDKWFQVAIPLSQTQRTAAGVLSGDPNARKTMTFEHSGTIGAVEEEGWRLWHVGYVWQQTGAVSREKFASTGQVETVTGEIIGIYLFQPARSSADA